MHAGPPSLAVQIHQLAAQLPAEVVVQLAAVLQSLPASDWPQLRTTVLNIVANPAARALAARFLDSWQRVAPQTRPESVALALLSASQSEIYHRQRQAIDLVWTGPSTNLLPLRRTDQALLQLISEAQRTLTIVSFAVYKAQSITHAIAEAARRGVATMICLETPESGEGKIAYDTIKALGDEVARVVKLYEWPLDQRAISPDGHHGSLHAKVAVADSGSLLISSANLTEYAMSLNMEMGILIRGGELPAQVEAHFGQLAQQGVLRRTEIHS